MESSATVETAGNVNGQQRAAQIAPAVDAERLAERVYRLMREEIRLERARTGGS